MSPLIHQKKQAWPKASKRRRVLWGALALAAVGCVLDKDDPCGPNEVVFEGNDAVCVCAPGAVAAPEGGCVACGEHQIAGPAGCVCDAGYALGPDNVCVACGAHETAGPTGCDCEPGYARGADNVCAEVTADAGAGGGGGGGGGIGLPCTADTDCTDLSAPHCELASGGGYCTSQNCDVTPCADGYSCNLAGTPPFCKRPPVGFGSTCAADADCASFDATYCNVFGGSQCYVRDCSTAPDSCTPGQHCCVLAAFGQPNLCLPDEFTCP